MTEPYDPGHDKKLMWDAFDRIVENGWMHHDDIVGRFGMDNLATHIKDWIAKAYRDRMIKFEQAAE